VAALLLLEPIPLGAKIVDFRVHPSKEKFSRGGREPCPLKLQDLLALPSDLDAHVLDFGTDVLDPHSAPSLDEPLGTAPELVVKPEPPEQDLDFTIAFHKAENGKKHERNDKPLGMGGAGTGHPRSLP
jgi:hypothetical protein